jgi:hypothetical protein
MLDPFLVALVIFLGAFTQSLTGFGSALVAMALLPALIGLNLAAPLVALASLTLETLFLLRYRRAFNFRLIAPMILAAYLGIPLGVLALSRVNQDLFLKILGLVILFYALYALVGIRLPRFEGKAWAYLAGFLAGLLGGAYNTSGPPVIIYGNARGWSPIEFKTNLQGFFLFTNIFIVVNHAMGGNFSPAVWRYYAWSIPAIVLGILAGTSLDRFIRPAIFRKLILIVLVILGGRLLL